jgi:hypothetical protein
MSMCRCENIILLVVLLSAYLIVVFVFCCFGVKNNLFSVNIQNNFRVIHKVVLNLTILFVCLVFNVKTVVIL